MFITHNEEGLVTAYSDKARNKFDLKEGETEIEVDLSFQHIPCKEGMLKFRKGKLWNGKKIIGQACEQENEK